jgi:O-antigen/teichoic acid export membrane protein
MTLKAQALKNVGWNWLGAAVNLIVGFFISPFILHRLGDEAFGIWVLIFSLTGYYGVFDFGIRSSIVKYVAECHATGDRERLNKIINTAFFTYSGVAIVLIAVVGSGSLFLGSVFHFSPGVEHSARALFLVVGFAAALGLPLSVFAGVLEGLQECYALNATQATASVLRALLIVLSLHHGMGLLTAALITVALPLLSYGMYAWKVMRAVPFQLGFRCLDRSTFRQMLQYSLLSFLSIVAFRLRFQTDAVLIGAMLSSSAITYFSIGSKLLNYSFLVMAGLGQIFVPMSSQFDAAGDKERLRKLFVLGNQACALTVFPIGAVLVMLGKPIIDVWVGSRYESSYLILLILLVPSILSHVQGGSRQILYGTGRHKVLAIVSLGEGIVNVGLSIAFIHYWGVVGDAFGTALPLTLTSVFFLPPYLCRMLNVSLADFLRDAYLLPLGLCVPFTATLYFMERWVNPRSYMQLASTVAAAGFVYGASLLWLFFARERRGIQIQMKVRQYLFQGLGW